VLYFSYLSIVVILLLIFNPIKMNSEQRDFISKVILPKLVAMAIDETLPMDMNEMCYSHFEDEATQYNIDNKRNVMLDNLGRYTSFSDDEELDSMLTILESHEDENEITGWIDGIQMTTMFETSFTVKQLLDEITPI
jgi:hypothetical protein